MLSLSLVDTSNSQLNQHLRAMQNYFNLRLLDHDDLGLYDQGDNIDESSDELVLLGDMREHLIEIVNITVALGEDGVVSFTREKEYALTLTVQTLENNF